MCVYVCVCVRKFLRDFVWCVCVCVCVFVDASVSETLKAVHYTCVCVTASLSP